MKILRLKLRGAIGIFKGLGKEEIEIDFTQYQPGLIALTGRNGSGKTTVMENLHPYRQMVSRAGSLQSHFYLKDSYRKLEFEQGGNHYESKILIDALTGGSQAFLLCNGKPVNDGKLTTYDEAIEKVLGSPELFFNSVFSGQKSKGIAELKPADRRKLFYELLNLTVYEQYLEKAKVETKANEMKLAEIEGEIRAITDDDTSIDKLETERVEALNHQAKLTGDISDLEVSIESINKSINDMDVKIKLNEKKLEENAEIEERLKTIETDVTSLTNQHNQKLTRYQGEIDDAEKLIVRNKKLLDNKEKITSAIGLRKHLEGELTALKENKNLLQIDYSEFHKDYSMKLETLADQEKKSNHFRIEFDRFNQESKQLRDDVDRIEKETEIIKDVPCDERTGAGCQFLINAYEGKEILEELSQRSKELDVKLSEKEAEVLKTTKQLRDDKAIIDEHFQQKDVELSKQIDVVNRDVERIENKIAEINANDWDKMLKELDEAESNVTLFKQKIESTNALINEAKENYSKELNRLKAEVDELNAKLDPDLAEKIATLNADLYGETNRLSGAKASLDSARQSLDSIKRVIATIEQEIEQFKKIAEKLVLLNGEKVKAQREVSEWAFLSKAFDKTGIPVLKLENSGVEITSIANELLSLFENKFRIVFETTKLKANKKDYKESFEINIVTEDAVTELSNLSGGEQVWVETALQLAISNVVRQQGKNISTAFLDECDGALSLENAFMYLDMITKSHEKSNLNNTFIITHRTELLDLMQQQIKLGDGVLGLVN